MCEEDDVVEEETHRQRHVSMGVSHHHLNKDASGISRIDQERGGVV